MGLFDLFKKKPVPTPPEGYPLEYEFKVVGMRHHEEAHDEFLRSRYKNLGLAIVEDGDFKGAVEVTGNGKLIGYVAAEDAHAVNKLMKTREYVISNIEYWGSYYIVTLSWNGTNELTNVPFTDYTF